MRVVRHIMFIILCSIVLVSCNNGEVIVEPVGLMRILPMSLDINNNTLATISYDCKKVIVPYALDNTTGVYMQDNSSIFYESCIEFGRTPENINDRVIGDVPSAQSKSIAGNFAGRTLSAGGEHVNSRIMFLQLDIKIGDKTVRLAGYPHGVIDDDIMVASYGILHYRRLQYVKNDFDDKDPRLTKCSSFSSALNGYTFTPKLFHVVINVNSADNITVSQGNRWEEYDSYYVLDNATQSCVSVNK